MSKAKVFVLYTGGTFGMYRSDSPGNPLVVETDKKKLKKQLPDSDKFGDGINVEFELFDRMIDSSNMKPDDWVAIAKKIYEIYDDYSGFVVK